MVALITMECGARRMTPDFPRMTAPSDKESRGGLDRFGSLGFREVVATLLEELLLFLPERICIEEFYVDNFIENAWIFTRSAWISEL
jgi:hypothetical protein